MDALVDLRILEKSLQRLLGDGRLALPEGSRGVERDSRVLALGELHEWDDGRVRDLLNLPEITVVKLGLARSTRLDNWQAHWRAALEAITTSGHELAAVAYADWQQAEAPAPSEIIAYAATAGTRYFLLDTFDKKTGRILTFLTPTDLHCGWTCWYFSEELNLASLKMGINIIIYYLSH